MDGALPCHQPHASGAGRPRCPGDGLVAGRRVDQPMLLEINRETQAIDMVIYRLTITSVTDALIARHRAGVKVRVIIEPTQYRNRLYPEYEMTGANIDRLWAAGITTIKQRQHEGLTHMKTLITSNIALNASSNFTTNWERDHNYFIPAQTKPAPACGIQEPLQRDVERWRTNFVPFQPQNPAPAPLLTPAISASNVPTTTRLEWNRAFWATSYDVYFGTSSGNPPLVARVNAVVSGDPPQTYSWTPPQPLQPNTAYYWKVVSRTFATDVNAAIAATSEFWGFTTAGSGSGGARLRSAQDRSRFPAPSRRKTSITAAPTSPTSIRRVVTRAAPIATTPTSISRALTRRRQQRRVDSNRRVAEIQCQRQHCRHLHARIPRRVVRRWRYVPCRVRNVRTFPAPSTSRTPAAGRPGRRSRRRV